MAKVIMVQGTMSNVGKSLLVGALCRIFKQDGLRAVPFKSQNMALNSFVTEEGLEIGRAQAMQAECARIKPSVYMNPILLKPTSDVGSQVIVNGRVVKNMSAREYFAYKKELVPDILKAYEELSKEADVIVIEGAGSPAEINLKSNDIVNMGLAAMVDAPVLLVGDIDRGGVFAQLLGTLELLEEDERARVKGLIINKFRGDKSLLDSGIEMLEQRGGVPVIGTVPYTHLLIDEEDSLSSRLSNAYSKAGLINIAVVRFPRISNYTDLAPFEALDNVLVSFVDDPRDIEGADLVILPGSKNTIADLRWMKESKMANAVERFASKGPVIGICGGFQMLGQEVSDPDELEEGGAMAGLGLLSTRTRLMPKKTRTQTEGRLEGLSGIFAELNGLDFKGYEIHMGTTQNQDQENIREIQEGNVFGTYVHGIFDQGDLAERLVNALAKKRGLSLENQNMDYQAFKDSQYDLLAKVTRENIDMDMVYKILG